MHNPQFIPQGAMSSSSVLVTVLVIDGPSGDATWLHNHPSIDDLDTILIHKNGIEVKFLEVGVLVR